ncbi:MAG: glycosyltransferase, partial [Acidobacteria bacterium]|nr:glycosyltransferase [Acidobacteriota bacterium]
QLGLGGSERQLYLLLKHLDKKIFEPHVVVINPSPHVVLNDRLEAEGVRVYAIPENCRGILRRARYLYRLFRNISPHIIHSWTVHDNPYAGLIGWLARVPARWGAVRCHKGENPPDRSQSHSQTAQAQTTEKIKKPHGQRYL